MRIIHWLISIVKRPWNRADVSKTSANEDYEYTYYNTLSFELQQTLRLAYKWINRRSQKISYNWHQFHRFLKHNPLPQPRIYHLACTLASH